jgi:hypothetical protein
MEIPRSNVLGVKKKRKSCNNMPHPPSREEKLDLKEHKKDTDDYCPGRRARV